MSFANSNLPIARFVPNWAKSARSYKAAEGIIAASRKNNLISAVDLGSEPGKKRQFKLTYYPVNCDAAADNCSASVCDAGTAVAPKQEFFTLSECTSSKNFTLSTSDVRLVDGMYTFSDHAMAQIAAQMPAMRKKLATQMLTKIYANKGLLPGGAASQRVQFVNTTTGAANLSATNTINRIFADTGFSEPFIIGGTEIFDLSEAIRLGGLNNLGQRIDGLDYTNKYYDALINEVVGDGGEHVLAFDPQVLKFISWSKNAGMFATDLQSVESLDSLYKMGAKGVMRGVLLDPVLGILWDLNVHYDECNDVFTYQYRLEWDIFFMPDTVCNDFGVNGIFHFTTCAPVVPACPAGDALPASPATATFEFDTNGELTFPFTVYDLSVAGRVTQPNITVANIAALKNVLNDGGGIVFGTSGTKLTYTGYTGETGITIRINGEEYTFTEAA